MNRRTAHWARTLPLGLLALGGQAVAEPVATVDRNGSLVAVEPYAPNIVRVTIATERDQADGKPGYGISAAADAAGWSHSTTQAGDVFASGALTVTVKAQPWPGAATSC